MIKVKRVTTETWQMTQICVCVDTFNKFDRHNVSSNRYPSPLCHD